LATNFASVPALMIASLTGSRSVVGSVDEVLLELVVVEVDVLDVELLDAELLEVVDTATNCA
jgi:hypothetical protein